MKYAEYQLSKCRLFTMQQTVLFLIIKLAHSLHQVVPTMIFDRR